MSSLEIAQLTGKQHAHVMRDIRSLLEQGVHESNFGLMYRINKLGNGAERKDPYYELTKKGCLILASGYDAKLRERIIDRWEELETEKRNANFQIPQSFSEALLLAAKQAKQIEEQQRQIDHKNGEISTLRSENAELQVQSQYARVILQNKSTALVTQIAQDYGMSAVKFNAMLRDMGIQRKVRSQWILTAPYIGKGYVQSSSFGFNHSDGTPDVSMTTEWTQRGRLFLYAELKRHGVLPLIESQAIIKFKN